MVPAGTLLFFNGETGTVDIYAVDKSTGAVLATLETDYGASHVVGGAHHPGRDSLFLVQDRVPSAALRNRIGEIDPTTGAVLLDVGIGSFFDVNDGDIDVCPSSGNLFVVSSFEDRIAELTPGGALLQYHPLPANVEELSGIAIGPQTGKAWVGSTDGTVWQLSGLPCESVAPPPSGECQDELGNGVICLQKGRFEMKVTWRNPNAGNALGPVNLLRFSDSAAEGYFANPTNVEILAKVIDGCALNGHYWAFIGGVTDQNVIVDIRDTESGLAQRYENPAGVPYQTVADTRAFSSCP